MGLINQPGYNQPGYNQFLSMRVSILYIATFAIFSRFVDLSKSSRGTKRDHETLNEPADASEARTQNLTIEIPAPVKRKGRGRSSSADTPTSIPKSASFASNISGITASNPALSFRPGAVDLEDLRHTLLNGKQNAIFNNKVDAIGASRMPAEVSHELMITCMRSKKEANLKHMLSNGFKFNFRDETRESDIRALIQAIVDEKVDFLSLFLDVYPVDATKLLIAAFNTSPNSKVLETLKNCLKKSGGTIDSGAILLAAETAADLQSIPVFNVIFESDMMTTMISRTKLLKLFSIIVPASASQVETFRTLLSNINKERRLTSPFEMNLLSQAAAEDNMLFLSAIEPCLNIFSWDYVLQAINIALNRSNYDFVDILLRTNNYGKPDFLFRLVTETVFTETVGKLANYTIIDKLANATYRDGMNLMVVDLNLMRICMRAAENGNIEVIDYLLQNGYFDLNTRFKNKSIFRIALENGQDDLVKFLIKEYGYSINDSDTPTVNPGAQGGDSLIYTARNSHAELFHYLLRLGANPNAKVNHNGKELNLIYWCIMKGQDQIVKLLLDFNCNFDPEVAASYNVEPATMLKIEELLLAAQQKK